MPFNSSSFLFLFLPGSVAGFVFCERFTPKWLANAWLLGCSLLFYAWANPVALGLLLPLVSINYWLGVALQEAGQTGKKRLLFLGVAFDLGVLGYFKYANFFVENLNGVIGTDFFLSKIALPLGISFVTFMQIAWLAASAKGESVRCSFFEYLVQACFFPQILSGPIVYQKEMVPQFRARRDADQRAEDFCVGATMFTFGLAKKVLVADTLAPWASQVFWAVGAGHPVTALAAWIGALAYAFQLYYDFSGYSDMALGVARLFGIRLPMNFDSPYKANSISDFWRRWHMTLSRFLRDYLYIPLGGNRCGSFRRSANLFLTMLLGGFWHGAGWTFLMWGALHGSYLVINHRWSEVAGAANGFFVRLFSGWGGRLLTFFSVLVAWIFFRAKSFSEGWQLVISLFGAGGVADFAEPLFYKSSPTLCVFFQMLGCPLYPQSIMGICLLLLLVIAWFFPNTQQILARYSPGIVTYGKSIAPHPWSEKWLAWKPSVPWFLLGVALFAWSLSNMSNISSFLYRDF